MKTTALKLTTAQAIKAAYVLQQELGASIAQVMYKPDDAEDDDYIGIDEQDASAAYNCADDYDGMSPEEAEEQFLAGRHSWELWTYEAAPAGPVNALEQNLQTLTEQLNKGRGGEPVRWQVQHRTLCQGWISAWRDIDEQGVETPTTYATRGEAEAALAEFLGDIAAEIASGEREEDNGYDAADFRVVEV
jgi:hypothetical protein